MGLERVSWAQKERIELSDMQAMADLPSTNLARVLQAGFQPNGVLRGGQVTADGASMVLTLAPLLAVDPGDPNGIVIVDADTTLEALALNNDGGANPSHYDRIDKISIKYSETTLAANRTFINNDASTNDAATPIRIDSGYTIQITQGDYAADPAAPATPDGYIALATVRVAWNVTALYPADVTLDTTNRPATDPSLYYPRYHYLPQVVVNTFPQTNQLFTRPLPAQGTDVVGLFNISFSLDCGPLLEEGGEFYFKVYAAGYESGPLIAEGYSAVPEVADVTKTARTIAFAAAGCIMPGMPGAVYYLYLEYRVNGVPHPAIGTLGSVRMNYLRATVGYFPTIAPWPGE